MSGVQHQHSSGDMSPIVQIIAGESVLYSLNNGITMLEFDDGEFYDVPDHVAKGMIARNWAKLATSPGGDPEHQPPPPAPPPPVQEPPKPGDEENGDGDDDEHHEKEPAERQALRTKSKRR